MASSNRRGPLGSQLSPYPHSSQLPARVGHLAAPAPPNEYSKNRSLPCHFTGQKLVGGRVCAIGLKRLSQVTQEMAVSDLGS